MGDLIKIGDGKWGRQGGNEMKITHIKCKKKKNLCVCVEEALLFLKHSNMYTMSIYYEYRHNIVNTRDKQDLMQSIFFP